MQADRYKKSFLLFLVSIFCCFFLFRPLNSEWFRIITADGLGYYAYLPAKFIYNDDELNFRWFNEVYPKYYAYNSFSTPIENFSAQYGDKIINKYFTGLSFLWLPFFFLAHIFSKLFGLPADGYSILYQVSIGLASVFYVCLGLWYLRKLLLKITSGEFISFLVPVLVFFGTNLFTYTIYIGSFTHAYSFVFITIAMYQAWRFLNEDQNKTKRIVLFLFCTCIVIFIRPFNILFLLAIAAFLPKGKLNFSLEKLKKQDALFLTLILLAAIWQFSIFYTQTGSLAPYTYPGERFYFDKPPHIADILWSYHAGWFLYVPLSFITLAGIFFACKNRTFLVLFSFLLLIIYLYASWWSWLIFERTIVDFTGILAILLAISLVKMKEKSILKPVLALLLLCIPFFQLKAFQQRNGILDHNYTYGEYYWRYFFTTRKVNVFPVNPKTVLQKQVDEDNFETKDDYNRSDKKFEGSQSHLVDTKHAFSKAWRYKLPDIYSRKGMRKLKTSFYVFVTGDISNYQLVYEFYKDKDRKIAWMPFYINQDLIQKERWELKEFGCDIPAEAGILDSVAIFIWNNENKDKLYIDKLKNEFFLTDPAAEMIQ